MANDLTIKQDRFCLAFFECGNAAEAYRAAYDVPEGAKDSWHYVEATQLLDNPKIALRLEGLKKQAEKLSIFNRQKALEEYEAARKKAEADDNPNAMVSAINGKVKLFGLDKPTKLELSNPDGSLAPQVLDLSALSEAELNELERIANKAGNSEGMG